MKKHVGWRLFSLKKKKKPLYVYNIHQGQEKRIKRGIITFNFNEN